MCFILQFEWKQNNLAQNTKESIRLRLMDIFLPRVIQHSISNYQNYPSSVKGKYLRYCIFASLGMGLSSAGGVLSTQSMLQDTGICNNYDDSFAMGLGAGSIPMAAALNWVLKDGLGQLGGMAFTAFVVIRQFDSLDWLTVVQMQIRVVGGFFLPGCSKYRHGQRYSLHSVHVTSCFSPLSPMWVRISLGLQAVLHGQVFAMVLSMPIIWAI